MGIAAQCRACFRVFTELRFFWLHVRAVSIQSRCKMGVHRDFVQDAEPRKGQSHVGLQATAQQPTNEDERMELGM